MALPMALQLTAALALATAGFLLRLYYLATHRRPLTTIPYNRTSTRLLFGDLSALTAEARRTRDPARMTGAAFAALRSPVVQLFLAPLRRPLIFVRDAREVDALLQASRARDFAKAPAAVAPFRPLVPGASICKGAGPAWRAQTRLWADVIGAAFLRDVAAPRMHAAARALARLLTARAAAARGCPFAAAGDFRVATFDVIWAAMLGADLHGLRKEHEAVERHDEAARGQDKAAAGDDDDADAPAAMATAEKCEWDAGMYFMDLVPATVRSPFPRALHFLYSLTPTYRKHWRVKDRLKKECFDSSIARLAEEGADEKKDVCALDRALWRFVKVPPNDVYKPTTDDMYDELLLLLMSGHETAASLLAWTAKILTNAPASQSKLRATLSAHFAATSPPGTPGPDAILTAAIPYLDASIEELVRLANIVPEIVRETPHDTELLGHVIPKGTTVVSSLYVASKPFPADVVPDAVRSEHSRNNASGYKKFWEEDIDEYRPEVADGRRGF